MSEKKLKIAYAAPRSSAFPSRAANTIHQMHMCKAFSKLGHDVTLFIASRDRTKGDIFESYGIEPVFDIVQVSAPRRIAGKAAIYALRSYFMLNEMPPDLVVGRSVHICAITSFSGWPTIYDSHSPIWESGGTQPGAYAIMRRGAGLCGMTTNSLSLKKMYETRQMAPPCGISVAHNGSERYPHDDAPAEWPGRESAMQVGYMGHLYPGRGVSIIIGCAGSLPDMDFHLVGGTEHDINYWKSKVNLPNVFFHGFTSPSEVYKYRNASDVLVAPYRRNNVQMAGSDADQSQYMNPIKLFEYMSAAKPIICSNVSVLKEVVEHERNALLCDPANVDDWVRALRRLQTKEQLREKLGKSAYRDFVNNFTWKARAARMLTLAKNERT